MRLEFSTKAETLKQLEGRLKTAQVLPQVTFTVGEIEKEPEKVWPRVYSAFGQQAVIVRSSALNEDTQPASQAG